MPSWANAVLQEIRSASARVISPVGEHATPPKLPSVVLVCGSGSSLGASMTVSASTAPDSSAAAATTSLNVDPGGYVIDVARLTSGLSGSASNAWYASLTAFDECPARSFGSKLGFD